MSIHDKIVRNPSLSGEVLDRLLGALLQGEIRAGEVIKEAAVARQLGVSRGPLREALSLLEGRQLVERVHGLGVRVLNLSLDDMTSLFEVRAALEGLACRLAAKRVTLDELAELEALAEVRVEDSAMETARANYDRDDDFHLRIVRASQNPRLITMLMDGLYYPVRLYRYRRARKSPERVQEAWQEHREIVAALRDRDPDRAEAAMRRHIENAMAFMIAEIDMDVDQRPGLALRK